MRIRISFTKTGALIYIGNLDLYTLWERATRRARLPLSYSKGFHPQPKIHFAAPLPLGYSSRCEVLDMRLDEAVACAEIHERLNAALPTDIRVFDVHEVNDTDPAVQTQVISAEYEVAVKGTADSTALRRLVDGLLAATSLPRRRRDREYDLRPLLEALEVRAGPRPDETVLVMRLKAQEGATGRPDEVLLQLGIGRTQARIERSALHFRQDAGIPDSLAG